jgi:hypothetical protein
MKKIVILVAMNSSVASALTLGLNVNGGYAALNAKALIPATDTFEATDINMTGFAFQLGVPVTFMQMGSLGLFAEPRFRYLTAKSKPYTLEVDGAEASTITYSYSGMQAGVGLGTKYSMGSLALATQLFFDASISGGAKATGTGLFAEAGNETAKQGAVMGFQADGYYNLSPSMAMGAFFTYGSSKFQESESKVSTIIFGGAFSMTFGAGAAVDAPTDTPKATKKTGTKKKGKKKAPAKKAK